MAHRVALVWAGSPSDRRNAKLEETRLAGVSSALQRVGIATEPAVYADSFADEVEAQLRRVDGVLVWVNPLVDGGTDRSQLDALLARVANTGIMVSAHPDVILRIGTKEVLFATRLTRFGSDTRLYRTVGELRERLPASLNTGPRVLKQYRGNGGDGVWKVDRHDASGIRVRHAKRGSTEEKVTLGAFVARCEPYFANGARMIDQPYQPRLVDGMIRAYLVRDRVAGFGEQLVNALHPTLPPGPRLYYPPTRTDFAPLKQQLEAEWIGELCAAAGIDRAQLPAIWDADFLYGPKNAAGDDTYVLCEINVSSVYPFPDDALAPLAQEVRNRLDARGGKTA